MHVSSAVHRRWIAYWRGVVMGAAITAGQIGPMGEQLAAHREAIAIVRVMPDGHMNFDPRERVGSVVLTRSLDLSDMDATRERSGGDLN